MNSLGSSITQSFGFVAKVGEQCEALAQLIKQEVSASLLKPSLSSRLLPGKWSNRYREDASGWVFSDAVWTLPLTPKAKKAEPLYLSIQLSIFNNNAEGGSIAEPLLHISCWESPVDHKEDCYMGFPMEHMTAATLHRLANGSARLFRWEAKTRQPDWWTYSVRLTDLNDVNDVRALITTPVAQLLEDVDAGERMLHDLPRVIRYSPLAGREYHYQAQ